MIKEALEYIFNQARQGANPAPHWKSLGGRKELMVVNGTYETVELEPRKLLRDVFTLESLLSMMEQYGDNPCVFVSDRIITAVLDDSDRQEVINMPLKVSPQMQSIYRLGGGVTQRQLVRVLRTELFGFVNQDDFLSVVRQVDFNVDRASRGSLRNDAESMGRSVEKTVRANAGEIPEIITATIPLYSIPSTFPSTIHLELAVDIDMDNEKFSLHPVGDCLERETSRIVGEIVERLGVQLACPVVEGTCESC